MRAIKDEDGKWLASQAATASFFGVSIQAFQRWGYHAVRNEGRIKLYDVKAIMLDRMKSDQQKITNLDLARERARQHSEQADKIQMENQVRRGELLEVAEVSRVVGDVVQSCRARFLAMPARLSKYLENQEARQIEHQLEDAIHDALSELALQPYAGVDPAEETDGEPVGQRRKAPKRGGKRSTR